MSGTKKFSEIRRPMTPERRARIDAIKAQMDAALDAEEDLREIVAYNGTTALCPHLVPLDNRCVLCGTTAESQHWKANHDRQVEIKRHVQSMLDEALAAIRTWAEADAAVQLTRRHGKPGSSTVEAVVFFELLKAEDALRALISDTDR